MRSKKLNQFAKTLRKELTPEEKKLWKLLRNRKLGNHKFRRQFPIDKYIADFCCIEKRLILELDGGNHPKNRVYDAVRDQYLRSLGFRILRIWNNELNQNEEGVLDKIIAMLKQ